MPRFSLLLLWASFAGPVAAQAPLHQRIDQLVGAKADLAKLAAAPASDEEFLRRVYLDFAGVTPTAAEARAFLKDASAKKREDVIDRLLAGPQFARHMTNVF